MKFIFHNKIKKTLLQNIQYLNALKMCEIHGHIAQIPSLILWVVPKYVLSTSLVHRIIPFSANLSLHLASHYFTKISAFIKSGIVFQILGYTFVTIGFSL